MADKRPKAVKSMLRKAASVREKSRQDFRDAQAREEMRPAEKRVGCLAENLKAAVVSADAADFAGAACEEASFLSREKYVPCGALASSAVYHEKDRRWYFMCAACADHNVRNRGGVLLRSVKEPARPAPPAISAATVLEVKALQNEKRALEGKLKEVSGRLKEREALIILALEAGVPTGPGCPPVAVDVEERVTPRWKDEALLLAAETGRNVGVYEAEVRARTTPIVIKKLVINGEVKKP